MSRSFNPYQVWLGLDDSATEPNHFELLGLDEAENDARTIAATADRAASRVRGCRPGEQAAEWAALLDQIAAAKKCLTDPRLRSEYLQSLLGNPAGIAKSSGLSRSTAVPARAPVDRNMYPPGLAPAMAPVSPGPAASSPSVPVDPQAAVPMPVDAAPQPLAMSPAGVPYLLPADPTGLTDPMRPAVSAMNGNPYPPTASPMAAALIAGAPMAAPPMDYGGAMAAVPAVVHPMAAVPMAMPVGMGAIPMAQALPYGTTAYALATAIPASVAPAATQPATGMLAVNNSSAAMLATKHARSGIFGPALLGLATGILLLSIGAGYLYWKSLLGSSDPSQVALGKSEPAAAAPVSFKNESQEQLAEPSLGPRSPLEQAAPTSRSASGRDTPSPSAELPSLVDSLTEKSMATKGAESLPAADSKSTTSTPPATAKPGDPPKPDPKPVPDSKTTPAGDMPAKTKELPKPTQEELTKLGRAMKKAREAIDEHNFDRAQAFISAATEMPCLPEHQAMLDRLKLLSESVGQYRKAIQESIGKLASGSSFQVGDANVGVVETGPEKVILRVSGQNRTYSIRDLPVGLAAAIAAQTLAADDPNTLTLKGAYVMASPRASQDDLKKAREFLEQASGSVDAAKELLLLFKDQYDLTTKP